MRQKLKAVDKRTALSAVALVITISLLAVVASPAVAQQNNTTNNSTNVSSYAPYYANESTDVNNESWMSGRENATLDNVVHMATRLGPFVIGDTTAPGDVGSAGMLVLGLVIGGTLLGTMAGANVGSVGGSTLAFIVAAGLVGTGLAPAWMWAVLLMGLGLIGTAVFLRAVR